jgi:hypothetical protein
VDLCDALDVHPGAHEPVVPRSAISVVGMDAVGRPLDGTHVHRPERVDVAERVVIGQLKRGPPAVWKCRPDGNQSGAESITDAANYATSVKWLASRLAGPG